MTDSPWRKSFKEALQAPAHSRRQAVAAVAEACVRAAMNGDVGAMREIGNSLDGPVSEEDSSEDCQGPFLQMDRSNRGAKPVARVTPPISEWSDGAFNHFVTQWPREFAADLEWLAAFGLLSREEVDEARQCGAEALEWMQRVRRVPIDDPLQAECAEWLKTWVDRINALDERVKRGIC